MALLPPEFLDAVVAIGYETNGGERIWGASGFLYGRFLGSRGDEKQYQIFLVTNRHVVQQQKIIWLRFNPEADEPAEEFPAPLVESSGQPKWLGHPDPSVDVAVLPINVQTLRARKIRYFYLLNYGPNPLGKWNPTKSKAALPLRVIPLLRPKSIGCPRHLSGRQTRSQHLLREVASDTAGW